MGCLGHTRSEDGTNAQSCGPAPVPGLLDTYRRDKQSSSCIPLCCLAWRVCDGMARGP